MTICLCLTLSSLPASLAFGLAGALEPGSAAEQAKGQNMLDEVRQAARARERELTSLYVRYSYHMSVSEEGEKAGIARHLRRDLVQITAFKGEKRYAYMALPGDPRPKIIASWNGELCTIFYPYRMAAVLQKAKSGNTDSCIYMSAVMFSLSDTDKKAVASGNTTYDLVANLDRPGWRVGARTEAIEGVQCVLLRRGAEEAMWLDPSKDFALIKRTYRLAGEKAYRVMTLYSSLVRVSPHIWLPRRIVEKTALATNPAAYMTAVFTVHDLSAKVEDRLFELQLPPGTLVTDNIAKAVYEVPSTGRTAFDQSLRLAERASGGLSKVALAWVLALNCAVVALLATWLLLGRVRK